MATLVVDGGHDLDSALKRAARNQGINLQQTRLRLESLQSAVREYRELFHPEQAEQLARRRELALQAMQSFGEFRPRLIGGLIHGDGPLDRISLLVLADSPEQVILHLNDRHIPWREAEVWLNFSGRRRQARPALRFVAGDATVELIVLDSGSRSDPPRDPVSGGKLEALNSHELRALMRAS